MHSLRNISACIVLLSSFVGAQVRKVPAKDLPGSAFKLVSVKVSGTSRYNEKEILAASGLEIGETVHEDDFQKVARDFGETGLFTNVAFSYQYSTEGTQVEFQVADADKLIPARFENFVWFTDSELQDRLRQRVPLFKGEVPVAGTLADQVSEALQGLLIERKIPAQVNYLRSTSQEDGPIQAVDYSVSGPAIQIQDVTFTGVAPQQLPALAAAAQQIKGNDYLRSLLREQADKALLPAMQEQGFLKAIFGPPVPKVLDDTPQKTSVEVNFAVTPGLQYKVSDIRISGNQVFPADKITPLLTVKAGQVANPVQLGKDIEAIQRLYGTRGYMSAHVMANPQFDDAQSTVAYDLAFHEGAQYKMGDLDIRGLDSYTTDRLKENWKIRGGEPFDESYVTQFLKDTAPEYNRIGYWRITIHQTPEEKDKVVDVSLRFDPER